MKDSLSDIAADDDLLDRLGGRLPVTSDDPVVLALAAWTTQVDAGAPRRRVRRLQGSVVPVLTALVLTVGGSSVAAALTGADVPVLASVGREMVGWAPGGQEWLASSDSVRADVPVGDPTPAPDPTSALVTTSVPEETRAGVEGSSDPAPEIAAGLEVSSALDSWAGSAHRSVAGESPGAVGLSGDRQPPAQQTGGPKEPGAPAERSARADDVRPAPGRPAEPGPPTEVGAPTGLGPPANAGSPSERRPDPPRPTGPGRPDHPDAPSQPPASVVAPTSSAPSASQGQSPGARTMPDGPIPPSASERAPDPGRPTDAGRPTDSGRPTDAGRPTG